MKATESLEIIKSISYSQEEIIKNIIKLYVPSGEIDVDPTYSLGIFYKNTGIKTPKYIFDIEPSSPECLYGDSRNLPLEDCSVSSVMFDPPFLATTGKSLSGDNGNKINKRFGVYRSEKELHQMYYDSMKEMYRILNENGILIFKCQDKISSGKQYLSHVFIINKAIEIGFYPKDIFILLAKNRIIAKWQRNQKHSRKYHCYFLVFEKTNKKIEYV